jgi:hypothetical protein
MGVDGRLKKRSVGEWGGENGREPKSGCHNGYHMKMRRTAVVVVDVVNVTW